MTVIEWILIVILFLFIILPFIYVLIVFSIRETKRENKIDEGRKLYNIAYENNTEDDWIRYIKHEESHNRPVKYNKIDRFGNLKYCSLYKSLNSGLIVLHTKHEKASDRPYIERDHNLTVYEFKEEIKNIISYIDDEKKKEQEKRETEKWLRESIDKFLNEYEEEKN